MAVQTIYTAVEESGNDVKIAFDFAFKIFNATDLVVKKKAADGTYSAALVLGVDYTVAFDSTLETGTVTYTVAPVTGGASNITRFTDRTQGTVYPREGTLPAKTTENAIDKLAMCIQELSATVTVISSGGILVGPFATVDSEVSTTSLLAIITDQRLIKLYLGSRNLGDNGWATLGGY